MPGILCLFLSAALLLAPAGLRAEPPVPASRTVIAALQADYPPTCFKDPKTGKLQGFAVDIMDEVARRAGFRVEYVTGQTWQEAQQVVLDGRADVIPALTVDEPRRKLLAFTTPLDILPISYIGKQIRGQPSTGDNFLLNTLITILNCSSSANSLVNLWYILAAAA